MVNIIDPNYMNMNIPGVSSLIPVLITSTQLAANYEMWENDDKIQDILNIEKNFFCKLLKNTHTYLDDKSIKCITLAILLYMYKETVNMMKPKNLITNELINNFGNFNDFNNNDKQ